MSGKATILAVDDTPGHLALLVKILTREGYDVCPAESGELALASVAANPPELILLDMRMPGMDGFEVLRRLKARPESSSIPVIFVSANAEVEQRVEGLKLGAVDFVTKPFQSEELMARVQIHLELRRLRTRIEEQALGLRRANEQLESEIAQRTQAEETLREKAKNLEEAMDNIKVLTGLLPICMFCKKIRDEQGYWERIETYIDEHSEATFSHGLCDECLAREYPDSLAKDDIKKESV